MDNLNSFSASTELSGADFGDKRLNVRLEKLASFLSARPGESFPEATGSVAALEATYRFLGNPKVTPEKILATHIEATINRASFERRVIVAHDTTELVFPGEEPREGLGWVNGETQGFLAHFSLVLSRSELVRPLGVLCMEPIFRIEKPKSSTLDRGKKTYSDKESYRWWNSVHKTEYLLPESAKPIHVMDREADDYELFSNLSNNNIRFVIRIRHNRAHCKAIGSIEEKKLFDFLAGGEVICERDVSISKKARNKFGRDRKGDQPRGARTAKLHMKAATIEMGRPNYAHKDLPSSLTVNCIHVYEVDAPEGTEPVDWKLITQEPIKNAEDILNIIDDYRARWTIEEYFKALKTGCAYEKRQLESKESLLNALAVFTPIAWQLLILKTLNRNHSELSAEYALTKTQIDVLRAVSKKDIPEKPTINQALLAIAALGGHIPNNGLPGWQVLGRGMDTLLKMEIAWTARGERM